MIINNAGSRRDVDFWTKHLSNDEKNDRAELRETRGLDADNLNEALLEMQEQSRNLPRLQNFMYHADFNPRNHERLSEEQWQRAFEIFEQKRGIPEGQPLVVFEHEKNGRIHRHVIWLRVDFENMRAFPDGLDWKVAHSAAREIEKELGLEKVIGPLDREPGTPRPPRAPEAWEMYRAMQTGIDPRDITAEVTALFQESRNATAFKAALEQHGYELVTGRRGLLILDSAGKEHSLAKRIEGVNTKELNAFMCDVDSDKLPTVEQAKEQFQDKKIAGLEADRATVRDEIAWEEALRKSAIMKEQKERRFVEPTAEETRAALRKREAEERHWPINPLTPQQGNGWTVFQRAASDSTRYNRTENLRGEAAKVQKAFQQSDNPKAFAAALDDRGIDFAMVTKAEADRSHRQAKFAKAIGNYAPRFKEGEIVIVTEQRNDYRRNGELIEPPRIHRLDQSVAQKFVKGLGDTIQLQGIDATLQKSDNRAQIRRDDREAINLEWATRPRGFISNAAIKAPRVAARSTGRTLGKALDFASDAFASLFAPVLTPEQKYEAAVSKADREAEAQHTGDISRQAADQAQQRQQEQEQQAARDRQREIERDR